ncbi:DUF397 domain-containing protein [Streptomyces pinistramenti]|uniref:DUF397 domain-containing protein n=1 Tax=Streptomyces pinistramenti TaxID=2884812 RepID=UPI001D061E07|nr:DUF397 domain-containing protein [Streptomyces pinistramenti]MCB5907866.1 DUF397 domain-containing protein [Streptomyces pinistramenti]
MASTETDLSTAFWRKSSYSNGDGGNCIEVAEEFIGAAHWRKSSYSNGDGGDCIEIADNLPGLVPVRDSKAAPGGPALMIPAGAWHHFVTAVKADGLTA